MNPCKRRRMAKSVTVVLISTVFGVGLLLYLFFYTGLPNIGYLLSQISIDMLFSLMLLLIISNALRAYRFHVVYRDQGLSFFLSLAIVFMCNCLSSLLPARLGDFSYPWFLKRELNIRYGSGVSMLFLLHFFDFFAVSVLFILSVLAVPVAAKSGTKVLHLSILLLGISLLVTFTIMYAAKNWHIEEVNIQIGLLRRLVGFVNQALEVLREVNSPQTVVSLSSTSLLIWLFNYAFSFFMVYRLSLTKDLMGAFFALNLSNLVNILPVQSVAGLGTVEGSWTAAFALIGIPAERAFPIGFLTHMIRLVLNIALAFLGAIFFGLSRKSDIKQNAPRVTG